MVIGVSEGEKIEKIYVFEEIMKNINVEIQVSQQTPDRYKENCTYQNLKLLKTKDRKS